MKFYDLGSLVRQYRINFNHTLKELGRIVGISHQYLNSIELKNKIPSTEKLRRLFVALSLKQKPNKPVLVEFNDEIHFPDAAELDLNRLKQLVFEATGLSVYEKSYEPLEVLTNSKLVVKEYMQQKGLDQLPIEELRHSFQIWALNDKPGESLFEDSAYKTAYNILRYRVNYVNFMPISDDFQWRLAFQNISEQVELLLPKLDKPIRDYWARDDDWKNYLRFYGLSAIAFFTRFRIYDPLGAGTTAGNFNIGGTDKADIRFVGIIQSNLPSMIEKLRSIITAHQVGLLREEPYLIKALGCEANFKDIKPKVEQQTISK